jgi:hypothetical protein
LMKAGLMIDAISAILLAILFYLGVVNLLDFGQFLSL